MTDEKMSLKKQKEVAYLTGFVVGTLVISCSFVVFDAFGIIPMLFSAAVLIYLGSYSNNLIQRKLSGRINNE